jgi:DNA-binding NarL/FixJ family response regulator
MAIRILLYEDDDSLRNSISSFLTNHADFELMAAMPNAITVANDITQFKPQAILMDIDMPEVNGVAAVKTIRSLNSDVSIIMFTVFEDEENIYNAICAGADGYLLKSNMDQLPAAIKDVLSGGAPMTSSVAKKVLRFLPKGNTKNEALEKLTTRETEILEHITRGFSYKMIAVELKITLETVRSHIKNIYKKLKVNSATEAIYKYTQNK